MIKVLILTGIILLGLCLSPWLAGNSGYVYIAAGNYQIETSLVVATVIIIALYWLIKLLFWIIHLIPKTILNSPFTPKRWQQRQTQKHTLLGALALAEEDWPTAEQAMIKGINKREPSIINLFAAARAAHHQQKMVECHQYLDRAAHDPKASRAAAIARSRYALKQGDLIRARSTLDALDPTSKSPASVLLLALEIYQAQADWSALKPLLPILNKRHIIDDTQLTELAQQTHTALLKLAASKDEAALEQCWQWLPGHDRKQSSLLTTYAKGLSQLNQHDKAIKLLVKQLNKTPNTVLLQAIPDIVTAKDMQVRKQLLKHEVTQENNAAYYVCLAKLYEQTRDIKSAKLCWQKACKLKSCPSSWLALASIQEQLGEQSSANLSYRQALGIH